MPTLSVIVPVYRCEAYLPACIDSILSQQGLEFELILTDDGSPDKSGSICDGYAARDSRIRVIHQENQGATAARLAAASVARGSYILAVDSDDALLPGLFEKLSEILERHFPRVICFHYRREQGASPSFSPELRNRFFEGEAWNALKSRLIYDPAVPGFNWGLASNSICTKVFEKELYCSHQQNVPREIILGEDLAVSAPALRESESVYFLEFAGYFYRDNGESQMNTFRERDVQGYLSLRSYLLSRMDPQNENAVNVFTAASIADHVLRAARSLPSRRSFCDCMKNSLGEEVQKVFSLAGPGGFSRKEKLKLFLVRHRLYSLF